MNRCCTLILIVLVAFQLIPLASAQMVTGSKVPGFSETFGVVLDQRTYAYSAQLIQSSVPANILWPGEQPKFVFQLTSTSDQPIKGPAKVDVIHYATRGRPGDIWKPDMYKIGDVVSLPIDVDLPARGATQQITISPEIPAGFGAYGLVADLGPQGRQFIGTFVRTFAASGGPVQYPSFCLDRMHLDAFRRLNVQAIRFGISYTPTTHKDYAAKMEEIGKQLKEFKAANVTVLLMVMGGPTDQPLGMPRPHLDENAVMQKTKTDMAWPPSGDADFQKWVTAITSGYGWPQGAVTGIELWNEPWEGISISGWGADMPRFREIFTHMALGVEDARKNAGVQVLIGGCDSSSNTLDKLFGDGSDDMLKWLDFCSIHYQGLNPPVLNSKWNNRKSPNGRVKIWDTESWVANTDDRVAAVVAASRAAGYDRAMGIYTGNVSTEEKVTIAGADGKKQSVTVVQAWPVAAAVGASQHFIGERAFNGLLFLNGLPWVMSFSAPAAPDDGTLVVVGDLGEEYGAEVLPFRTARGIVEVGHKQEIRQKLAKLAADAPERTDLEAALLKSEVLSGATLSLGDAQGKFILCDFYGNPIAGKEGKIIVPLDGRGFFLRTDGSAGSFAALVEEVKTKSRVEGIAPLATKAHDMTARIEQHPVLRLNLTNVLNRPVAGTLQVKLGSLTLDAPEQRISFKANETKDVLIKVAGGAASPNNSYRLSMAFDGGADGKVFHDEDMHCNVIARRTIAVDGKLDDWKDVVPQNVAARGVSEPTVTEAAWFPFVKFDASVSKGFANGYLASDEQYFYFAAKVADDTPDDGMMRFEKPDEDQFFYPEVSYQLDAEKTLGKKQTVWVQSAADARYLEKAGDTKDRSATVWESTYKAFAIDVKLPADQAHQMAFYFLDNDDSYRRVTRIDAIDLDTGKTLLTQNARNCGLGRYMVFKVAGNVRFKFFTTNFLSAAVAGIFFDPANGDSSATGKGAFAQFVKSDDATQGNWKGVYGSQGYNIIGSAEKYPAYASVATPEVSEKKALHWPEGVRRYSYRRRPELPSGNGNGPNRDNVQIAFNVFPFGQNGKIANPPGVMPCFTGYTDTDYEYALNPVSAKSGGGVEIWRLLAPGMPVKNFYPRQGRSPMDGPVKDGKLAIVRDGNTRLVECAIPWTEIPDVKKAKDEGRTVKFSFRVNDNGGPGCLELAYQRSVSRRNPSAFHASWIEHWANEVEFAFEK